MADEADLAFDAEQSHLTLALSVQRSRRAVLRPIGSCHYCANSDAMEGRLFCDRECASAWEYEESLRRRTGVGAGQASYPGRHH